MVRAFKKACSYSSFPLDFGFLFGFLSFFPFNLVGFLNSCSKHDGSYERCTSQEGVVDRLSHLQLLLLGCAFRVRAMQVFHRERSYRRHQR